MSAQLSTYKRLLSKYCTKLETVIARLKSEKLETIKLPDQETSPLIIRESHRRLEEGIGAIETCNTKIQELLQNYAVAIDKCETVNEKETEDFEEYTSRGETLLCTSLDYIVLLKGRVNAFMSYTSTRFSTAENYGNTATAEETVGIKRTELPTLPIPLFHGDLWEWDNFWTLFDTNVNSQPLPELYKFNYLLRALRGEPLQAVKKFRVSQDNYAKAITFLKTKYGDNEQLINRLYDRLDRIHSVSPAIKEQRKLLEQIQAIVAQLQEKNEHVDNQCIIKQVLSKFPIRLQRKVLERKYIQTDNTFGMETLLKLLEEFITTDEKVSLFTREVTPRQGPVSPILPKVKEELSKWINKCMYCGEDHKSIACTKYTTPHSRTHYLREHKLCFICASPKHITADCKKRMCFECQGPHHTSCCFKKGITGEDKRRTYQKAKETKSKESRNLRPAQTKSSPVTSAKIHQTSQKSEEGETTIYELQTSKQVTGTNSTYLPTGEIQVMNPITRNLRKIPVLLDTGAELSFIDKNLAEELHLPTIETTRLRLRTFGSEKVNESWSRKVELDAWDAEGNSYQLRLLTYDNLTKPLKKPPLLEEDMRFVQSLNLNINIAAIPDDKPLILLGCDQLWQLIKEGSPYIRLPSGLHLLPTHLSHLLTGQVHTDEQITQVMEHPEEPETWDKYWSLESQVNGVLEEIKEKKDSAQIKSKNTSKVRGRITKATPRDSKQTKSNKLIYSTINDQKELEYLTEVIASNRTMTESQLQKELLRTRKELQQQVEIITTINQEWLNFEKRSQTLTQQIITTGRLLRAARAASDCYLKLCTRYILFAKWLESYLVKTDQEWLSKRFLRKIRFQKKQMSALIDKLEKDAEIAENLYRKRLSKGRQGQSHDGRISRLQQRLKGMDKMLFEIKAKIAKSEASLRYEVLSQSGEQKSVQVTTVPKLMDARGVELLEDEDQLVLLNKKAGDDPGLEESHDELHDEGDLRYTLNQRGQLSEELDKLEKTLRILPHRGIGNVNRRTHAGTDGDERLSVARKRGQCVHCAQDCSSGRCRFSRRPCFYCKRIRGTITDLQPRKSKNLHASCVPSAKATLRKKLLDAGKKYRKLKQDIEQSRVQHVREQVQSKLDRLQVQAQEINRRQQHQVGGSVVKRLTIRKESLPNYTKRMLCSSVSQHRER